jgi:hypothetical protein
MTLASRIFRAPVQPSRSLPVTRSRPGYERRITDITVSNLKGLASGADNVGYALARA